jgi:hypothetical protein
MKSNEDLVTELKKIKDRASYACLAVAFPRECKTINGGESFEACLEQLNQMLEEGGIPLGYIAWARTTEGHAEIWQKVLDDYTGDDVTEAAGFLGKMLDTMAKGLKHEYPGLEIRQTDEERN